MLKIYGFKKVNKVARGYTRDLRVLWALEEMQTPFELVGIDHPANELATAKFHQLNPFEQLPVIDDDGVVLSESGAILIYLARKSGKLMPADAAGEAQVLRWCFVALNSVELPLVGVLFLDWQKEGGGGAGGGAGSAGKYREFLVGWASRHLGNLEGWLEGREFIANDDFSIADILLTNVLSAVHDESLLAPYPRVRAYRDR
ncbi:MAG: glutathione S-transferase family protein, partial [Proteobacteria bacterium]